MLSANSESGADGPRRRRRSARSCRECHRRKVKCDRKEPCSHCVLSKAPCVYNQGLLSVSLLPGHNVRPSLQAAQLSSSPGISPGQQAGLRPPSPHSDFRENNDGGNSPPPVAQSSPWTISKANEANALGFSPKKQPSTWPTESSRVSAPTAASPTEDVSSLPQIKQLSLNKSRLFCQTHWTSGAHEFRKIGEFLSSETGNSTEDEAIRGLKVDIHDSLQRCKLLAKSMKVARPSRCYSFPLPIFLSSQKETMHQIAQLYIFRFESVSRIFHIPTFWTEYEHYCRSPAESTSVLQMKVQLVLAIGSCLHPEFCENGPVRSAACQWIYAAQSWVSGLMEKDRLSIGGLQVQCLLILARQLLSVGGDISWIAIGTLVHTAIQMGLHRDPKHFAKMSILHSEIRRRLWATILEMNVQGALDAGVQPTISFEDFDTAPPSNCNDEDIDEGTQILEQQPDATVTDTSLQLSLFRSLRTRLEIVRRMNGIGPQLSYDEVLNLSSTISKACHECKIHVRADQSAEGATFKHNLSDLFIRRFLLILHRPFASRARTNPMFYFSRKTSLDAATALLSPAQDDEFSRLALLSGGIFKSRIIHACLALTSELLIEAEEVGRTSTTQWLPNYRRMLVEAIKEARRQLGQRMQFGDTNVKLHMKLSIALSQAESTESGTSLQQQMAQSAKESLHMAYSIIQARAGPPVDWSQFAGNAFTPHEDAFSHDFNFDDILGTSGFMMDEPFG